MVTHVDRDRTQHAGHDMTFHCQLHAKKSLLKHTCSVSVKRQNRQIVLCHHIPLHELHVCCHQEKEQSVTCSEPGFNERSCATPLPSRVMDSRSTHIRAADIKRSARPYSCTQCRMAVIQDSEDCLCMSISSSQLDCRAVGVAIWHQAFLRWEKSVHHSLFCVIMLRLECQQCATQLKPSSVVAEDNLTFQQSRNPTYRP